MLIVEMTNKIVTCTVCCYLVFYICVRHIWTCMAIIMRYEIMKR